MANFINLDLLTRYDSNIKNYFNHADERMEVVYDITTANTTVSFFSGSLTNLTYVDWGDSTTADKNNNSHTYTAVGTYRAYFHGVTAIGANAFASLGAAISSVYIPNMVTSIGDYAFAFCYGIKSINIPDSVTSIGESAFEECFTGIDLIVGKGVTSIGSYAFSHVTINSLIFTQTTPPTITSSIGLDYVDKIYVPLASLSTYKSATNWSAYASKIVAIVDTGYMDSNLPTLQDWTV